MNRRGFLRSIAAAVACVLVPVPVKAPKPKVTAKQVGDFVMYTVDTGLKPGYFYAPYVPIVRPVVALDPDVFVPRRGILTRYGRKQLQESNHLYSRIRISDFA